MENPEETNPESGSGKKTALELLHANEIFDSQ
jgi:hypothetical protein